jgi:hypothetical protein
LSVRLLDSPMAIILVCILIVALASVLTKWFILPLLGLEWPFRRVSAPWRFSLQSIIVLIAVSAIVLALLRESRDASLVGLMMVLVVWLTVVRYIALRQSLSDRSRRQFSTMLGDKEHEIEPGGGKS